MKIKSVRAWHEAIPLTRPYTIAFSTHSDVDLLFVELVTDSGTVGLGSASPSIDVTGESLEDCRSALTDGQLDWLVGRDPRHCGQLCSEARTQLPSTPAARAALDMAIWDLFARLLDSPLVDVLGRCHESLPTSITIGIKSTDEAIEECREYLDRGFRHIKVKIGSDLDADIERVARLHEVGGNSCAIRVDANQGYTVEQTEAFFKATKTLGLELIEQPLAADAVDSLRALSPELKQAVAADESLHHERDALELAQPPGACGIYNIKLMKCGGVSAARGIATIAGAADINLMWGCMDESVISIAAALHAAFSSPTTRYLDLDGSFDLARDPAMGGFTLHNGCLTTLARPGLGVSLRDTN